MKAWVALTALLLGVGPARAALGRRSAEAAPPAPQRPALGEAWHARPTADCLGALCADKERGLATAAVEAARETHGRNELQASKATPLWRLFLEQLDDSLVKVLLATAAVSALLAMFEHEPHGWVEPVVILSILALNGPPPPPRARGCGGRGSHVPSARVLAGLGTAAHGRGRCAGREGPRAQRRDQQAPCARVRCVGAPEGRVRHAQPCARALRPSHP
jgi:hypothetical protein